MLEAKKSAWFEKVFALYNRNLLERRFHSLQVSGIDSLRDKNPKIVYVNHSSWWDGLVAFEISRLAKADSFIMMEEKQLRNLFLFRRLGAFSVIRENPRQAVRSLNYAINLLKEKSARTIWIFPQGEVFPNDIRPLNFQNGLAMIIKKTGTCAAISLAIRYEFLGEFKPCIFVKIGKPEILPNDLSDSKILIKRFENQLTETLDNLKRDVVMKQFAEYQKLF